jgi:hypothetical protein
MRLFSKFTIPKYSTCRAYREAVGTAYVESKYELVSIEQQVDNILMSALKRMEMSRSTAIIGQVDRTILPSKQPGWKFVSPVPQCTGTDPGG